ncbi:MAG: sensor histidine kinase [Spirochaetales bacterium]
MKPRSIRTSLILSFTLVVVLSILILGLSSGLVFQKNLLDNNQSSTLQLVGQLNRVLDGYIGYMEDLVLVASGNSDVRAYLESPAEDPVLRARVSVFLKNLRTVRRDIDSVFVVRSPNEILTSEANVGLNPFLDQRQLEWYLPYLKTNSSIAVSSARVENLLADRYTWVVSLARPSPDQKIVQVDLNYAVIRDLCKALQLGRTGYVYIVNSNGDLVYHPRQQLVYSKIREEKTSEVLAMKNGTLTTQVGDRTVVYTAATSTHTGWTVVGVSFLDEVFSSSRDVFTTTSLIALGSLLVAILLAWLVSRRISAPIEELRRSMQKIETGDFDIEISVQADNELTQLANDCNLAIKTIRELMLDNEREQENKRRQDLLLLQSQINPHFLYNTLDSIVWMCEMEDGPGAIKMTTALAKFFRLGISRGSDILTLKDEAGHVESYLQIQKMRYGDKFEYSIKIDDGIREALMLRLLLQPLVENALYHGIKPKEGPGRIEVLGHREGANLMLTIRDDGVGMSSVALERLQNPGSQVHIGLENVQERIRIFYGTEGGLEVNSTPGKGTEVRLTLPFLTTELS